MADWMTLAEIWGRWIHWWQIPVLFILPVTAIVLVVMFVLLEQFRGKRK